MSSRCGLSGITPPSPRPVRSGSTRPRRAPGRPRETGRAAAAADPDAAHPDRDVGDDGAVGYRLERGRHVDRARPGSDRPAAPVMTAGRMIEEGADGAAGLGGDVGKAGRVIGRNDDLDGDRQEPGTDRGEAPRRGKSVGRDLGHGALDLAQLRRRGDRPASSCDNEANAAAPVRSVNLRRLRRARPDEILGVGRTSLTTRPPFLIFAGARARADAGASTSLPPAAASSAMTFQRRRSATAAGARCRA